MNEISSTTLPATPLGRRSFTAPVPAWAVVALPGALGLVGAAVGAGLDYAPLLWGGIAVAAAAQGAAVLRIRAAKTEELVRRALVARPVGQRIMASGGREVLVNDAFRALAGAGPGDDPLDALARHAGDAAAGELRRLAEEAGTGTPARSDLSLERPDGPPEWRRVEALPIEGVPGAVHWRLEDISPRRQLEGVMIAEQARLGDFLEHAPIGFFSVDRDGVFVFVNPALAGWLGVAAEDLVRGERRLHEFLLAPPGGAAPYDIVTGGGAEQRAQVVMIGSGGRQFHAEIVQSVATREDGAICTRSAVRDLTPERSWAKALRRAERRFQSFFEDSPIGVALIDGEGRVGESNPAFLDLLGTDAADVTGRPFTDLVIEEGQGAVTERLDAIRRGEDPAEPLVVRFRGRREREAQMYARRQRGGGHSLHFIDLTERRHLEAQFAQSQKMQAVGQLAGGVAHDFNNLLTAMIGFCDLLLLRHKPGDQSFSDIMQIKQNANRAANLVRQLLAFSRQQTLQARVLNVTDVLAELANLLRRLIGENIELRMLHGRDLGLIKVDQNQLEQVIINLCVNARDAMPGGGRLTVVTSNRELTPEDRIGHDEVVPGEYVSIEVIDTGHGIPPEHLARIFEPFFSTKAIGSGTGLGLSTVYGIVRQTGGYVMVDSAPGEGARFTILLPRHKGEARTEAAEPRERVGSDLTGSATILLVEDEDAVRVFSSRALRNKGYQVLEAKNGEVALNLLMQEREPIDLMITDVVMPLMDGPTLARKVRETRPDMRVIFISGYAEDRFKDELGDMHFLPKPFSLKQLAAKVKDVIREG